MRRIRTIFNALFGGLALARTLEILHHFRRFPELPFKLSELFKLLKTLFKLLLELRRHRRHHALRRTHLTCLIGQTCLLRPAFHRPEMLSRSFHASPREFFQHPLRFVHTHSALCHRERQTFLHVFRLPAVNTAFGILLASARTSDLARLFRHFPSAIHHFHLIFAHQIIFSRELSASFKIFLIFTVSATFA